MEKMKGEKEKYLIENQGGKEAVKKEEKGAHSTTTAMITDLCCRFTPL